jgi:SAM-dependent methyltransferase
MTTAPQVSAEHYAQTAYQSRERYYSYVEQIVETSALRPASAIEVGVGFGFVTQALRSLGIQVTTVDFARDLNPDIVASVESIPLPDDSADVSLCFQVLEHLPFERFSVAVQELARVSKQWVFLSLPDARPALKFEFVRGMGRNAQKRRWMLNSNPLRRPVAHVFDGQHYWEVGKRETPLPAVLNAITDTGLVLEKHYRLYANPYHYFLLVRKPTGWKPR